DFGGIAAFGGDGQGLGAGIGEGAFERSLISRAGLRCGQVEAAARERQQQAGQQCDQPWAGDAQARARRARSPPPLHPWRVPVRAVAQAYPHAADTKKPGSLGCRAVRRRRWEGDVAGVWGIDQRRLDALVAAATAPWAWSWALAVADSIWVRASSAIAS